MEMKFGLMDLKIIIKDRKFVRGGKNIDKV